LWIFHPLINLSDLLHLKTNNLTLPARTWGSDLRAGVSFASLHWTLDKIMTLNSNDILCGYWLCSGGLKNGDLSVKKLGNEGRGWWEP
jgi:hypothetical protein